MSSVYLFLMLEVSVLASGSSGNCFYICSDAGDILIDAGISCKQICQRLQSLGKSIENIKGIFVTHEHSDHISGIETLSHKFNIPVYVNSGTLENCFIDMGNINLIHSNEDFDLDGLKILPFSKNHDAADPVSFLIKNGSKKISVITDVGCKCDNVINAVRESDMVILEANHDINMLKNGHYPHHLKKRIGSIIGHLSNYDSALLVLEHANAKIGKQNSFLNVMVFDIISFIFKNSSHFSWSKKWQLFFHGSIPRATKHKPKQDSTINYYNC